ncbi:hypothetical protein P4110_30035 [Pseudomonas aeruginosa]|nr:hypothetical protein [Pseudomonas aeruginosa]
MNMITFHELQELKTQAGKSLLMSVSRRDFPAGHSSTALMTMSRMKPSGSAMSGWRDFSRLWRITEFQARSDGPRSEPIAGEALFTARFKQAETA